MSRKCGLKGAAQQGFVVELQAVPHQFLREAPLVDRDWIDRYILEPAEWGARLVEKGFLTEERDDNHPLAWQRIIDHETKSEANAAVTMKLWQQTRKHLAGFPGRTRVIDERQYPSFADYLKWRGMCNKGDLKSGMCTGLVVFQWNQLVEAQEGEDVATLTGVKVGKLSRYLDGYRYGLCQNACELVEEMGRRESPLESLWVGKPESGDDERFRGRVERWKGLALGFLPEIYTLRKAFDTINQRYFDRQQPLFPAVFEGFDQLLALAEKSVGIYNDALAVDIEHPERLLGE